MLTKKAMSGKSLHKMKILNYNYPAANVFDRALEAQFGETGTHKPVSLSAWTTKHKGLIPACSPRISLRSPINALNHAGFFIAAVYEYGRDNQPNDIRGNATRTGAGGNGGLYHRASAGASSLLIQAFKPLFEDVEVCDCHKRRMAPQGHALKGQATTC